MTNVPSDADIASMSDGQIADAIMCRECRWEAVVMGDCILCLTCTALYQQGDAMRTEARKRLEGAA